MKCEDLSTNRDRNFCVRTYCTSVKTAVFLNCFLEISTHLQSLYQLNICYTFRCLRGKTRKEHRMQTPQLSNNVRVEKEQVSVKRDLTGMTRGLQLKTTWTKSGISSQAPRDGRITVRFVQFDGLYVLFTASDSYHKLIVEFISYPVGDRAASHHRCDVVR